METAVEKSKGLFTCFIDFEKRFDTVPHELLGENLKRLRVDAADLRVLTNLY